MKVTVEWDNSDGGWWMVRVDGFDIDGFRSVDDAWCFVQSKEIAV
jgi:hypothetical protein